MKWIKCYQNRCGSVNCLPHIQPTAALQKANLVLYGNWSSHIVQTHVEHQLVLKNHEVEGAKNIATRPDNHEQPFLRSWQSTSILVQQPLCANPIRPPQLSLPLGPQLPVGRCLLSRQEEQPQCTLSAEQQLSCQQQHWDGLSTSQ